MKPLMVVIVVAALAAGTVAWAGTQDTYYSWGQYHWPGMNQMQMVGQTPMTGQAMGESRTYAACPYGSHQCSHWYGRMSPGHRADCHTGCSAGGYVHSGSRRCR